MENLTKENLFDELMLKYPVPMKAFCDWIDNYKKEVQWDRLFLADIKYHNLPLAMQVGIFMQYIEQASPVSDYRFEWKDQVAVLSSLDGSRTVITVWMESKYMAEQL